MIFAFILLLIVTFSGLAVTYILDEGAPLWARACAGIIVGQVLLGLVAFVFCTIGGMSLGTAWASVLVAALPIVLLRRKDFKQKFDEDFAGFRNGVKNFVSNPTSEKSFVSLFYLALIILMFFFFDRAMFVKPDGIYIGAPNNLGDISFHLQGIYGFTDGQNFPPQSPSYAGTKFTYPFMVNLVAALLIKVGASVQDAIFWQNMTLIVALIGLFNYFTFRLTKNRIAAQIAPFLFLFSGGLGFLMFFRDAVANEQGIFGFFMNLPNDYTLRTDSTWRWGNTLTVLLITQRSMLFGLPLALVILTGLWRLFSDETEKRLNTQKKQSEKPLPLFASFPFNLLFLGLLAGTLPLAHAHSFAVIMGMAGCMALLSLSKWKEWTVFFAAASLIAVPELLWATTGTANNAKSFLGLHFGWDNETTSFLWFWFKNTGLFIPLLFAAVGWLIYESLESGVKSRESGNKNQTPESRFQTSNSQRLLLFLLPFALCFIVPNVFKLAPWIWDNIKVLVYWFVASVPLVALILAKIWQRELLGKIAATGLILILTLAGFLDVWRISSQSFEYRVYDREAIRFAEQIRQKTEPDALIMSAPHYISPVVLTGRRWFMGYTGHLWSHGINPTERDYDLKRIYAGTNEAIDLIRKNGIDYVIVGKLERESDQITVNEAFFKRFPVVAESGAHRIYKVN